MRPVNHNKRSLFILAAVLLSASMASSGQRTKVIVDQDARGPGTTDIQSILMFAQSPKIDVLGVTIVTGDQWAKEEAAHTLRALEIANRTDIPVYIGARQPLLNTREESQWWDSRYGIIGTGGGAWSGDPGGKQSKGVPHDPDVIPPMPEGEPHTKVGDENAVNFIIRMVHKYPGEVTIWAGGPLTNIALAISMDPDVPKLAKDLVVMGGSIYAETSRNHGRREFNWWFDPEAVRIVLSASWKKITITPIDVSIKTRMNTEVQAEINKANTPLSRYLDQFWRPTYMWDEIAAATVIDPSFITDQREFYVNIDSNHGENYGETIFIEKKDGVKVGDWWKVATVQFDLDTIKFYKMYVDLMSLPPGSAKPTSSDK
jgi:purine nucleosidase